MEWYERRPVDYKDDTWHLSLAEHGAYNLLIDHYYLFEGPLPDNDRALASICNCAPEEWGQVKKKVRAFFVSKGGKLHKKKCDKILNVAFSKRNDGAERQRKYRKKQTSVTRDKRVSDASTGQDRTGQDSIPHMPPLIFEIWWKEYPNKKAKKKALSIFNGILKRREATIEELTEGLARYKNCEEVKNGYVKHPTTWLNQGCWNDEPSPAQKDPILQAIENI